MTRISTLAANTLLINQILNTQSRLLDLETQITSEKVSQTYKGIAVDSQRLVNLENTRDQLRQFIQNNQQIDTRINIASTAVEAIRETIKTFQSNLSTFAGGATSDPTKVADIQAEAFRSLKSIEDLLNTEVDGRFVFSGSRADTAPVDLGLSSLASFQAQFDGSTIQVATTRVSNLADFSISSTKGFNSKSFDSRTVSMVFDDVGAGADTITAAAGTFRYPDGTNLPVGAEIVITGTTGATNDGTFQIASVSADGSTVTLAGAGIAADQTSNARATARTILTFADANPDTVTGPAGTFFDAAGNALGAGTRVTFSNTTNNNATYTIASVSADGSTATLIGADAVVAETARSATATVAASTSFLTFQRDDGSSPATSRITGQGAPFANVAAGTFITISGTTSNNGTYEVLSVPTPGEIVVRTEMLVNEAVNSATTTATLTAADGTTVSTAATGDLTIVRDNGASPPRSRITAANAGTLSGLQVGQKITLAGTPATNNDGTYTVAANDGTNLDIVTQMLTDEGTFAAPVTGTVSASSYYSGDQTSVTHRVSKDRDFEFDVTAVDPGFEKAIRAMRLIMQGTFRSEGGLDQNTARVGQALSLLDSSLDRTTTSTPPFGTEQAGSIDQIQIDLSFNQVLVERTNNLHKNFIGFLDANIADIENVDTLDAITRLLDDQRALEASFQAFSKIRQLSLLNFI